MKFYEFFMHIYTDTTDIEAEKAMYLIDLT